MKFKVFCNDQLIGETDLEWKDEGMNVLSGNCVPTPDYENVRSIFRIFADAIPMSAGQQDQNLLDLYFRKRDELLLTVVDVDGIVLTNRFVHI